MEDMKNGQAANLICVFQTPINSTENPFFTIE